MTYNQFATTMTDLEDKYMTLKMHPEYGPEHYAWGESDLISIKMQRLAAHNPAHAKQYHTTKYSWTTVTNVSRGG